ncbi:MAG: efflux RND transporter permease subunit [Victivallales bacterium]|nr:efflux RND transporter permease subunit [Victivallales bacterium]
MFASFFVSRPKFAIVISLVISLLGTVCLLRLPIAEYPEIAPPTVQVTATYPGATSQVLTETVATVIEEQCNGIEDLLYFKSDSDNNGNYTLTLTFKPGIDGDIAQVNVQNAIQRATSQLPALVQQIGVTCQKQSTDIAAVYVFMTDDKALSELDLNNYVRMNVRDAFARLPGMGNVQILGQHNYSMRIWLDPFKMAALGVSPELVMGKLNSQNLAAAAGAVGSERSSDCIQVKLNVKGRLRTPEEFAEIILKSTDRGEQVRLGDVATLELGAERYVDEGAFNGRTSVALALFRQTGANAVQLVKDANAMLAELRTHFPEGLVDVLAYDPSDYIMENVREIARTLIFTIALVILITWLFLQDWRASLVPAIAIPVSLLGTFFVMALLGYSINVLTMFGLILVIGSLVDNAIVVVENTSRIINEEHLDARQATIKSMGQITSPVIAATLVVCAIYAPMGFYGGIIGTIYIQFAMVMCVALLISLVNSLTLSPALCALLLRPQSSSRRPFILFRVFENFIDGCKWASLKVSVLMVRRLFIMVALMAAVGVAHWGLLKRINGGFLPDEDKGSLLCELELPPGAALARTSEACEQFTNAVKSIPGVRNVTTVAGYSLMSGAAENLGFMIVDLRRWPERPSKDLSISAIRDRVMGCANQMPEAQLRVFQPPAIMGLGVTGGVTLAFRTTGDDTPLEFESQVGKLLGLLNDKALNPDVLYAFSSYNASTPQRFLDIDRHKAEALGVSTDSIFTTLQNHFAGIYVNDFNIRGYSFQVKTELSRSERAVMDDLENVLVQNSRGEMVPLISLCEVKSELGARKLERFNQNLSATVTVIPRPGASTGKLMADIRGLIDKNYSNDYSLSWTDMSYQEDKNQGRMWLLMLMALTFAYLFMAAQYESWTIPIPVVLTVSFATLGGLLALYLGHRLLDIYAQLGLIMLVGLCSKSIILMVEFCMQRRAAGRSVEEAAADGFDVRYRAVMMTAWSFIIGVLPLLFASGAGAEARRMIGVTTFWGMLAASTIGLVFVPPLYALFQRLAEFCSGRSGQGG